MLGGGTIMDWLWHSPPPPPPCPPGVGGFEVCAGSTQRNLWTITSGAEYCQFTNNGACVTDGVGNYGNNERCTITANVDLYASAPYYSVEVRHARPPPPRSAPGPLPPALPSLASAHVSSCG